MGAVHRALDPVLEREVALKVMLPRIADDPEHKRRFEREARAVARMSHPNVVTVFDLGYHTDGSPYIVMELLKGHDLLQTLRSQPALSLERKLRSSSRCWRAGSGPPRGYRPPRHQAREHLHQRKRDGQGHGLRRGPPPRASGATGGVMVGTANYMSPEQVMGGPIDGRSDLFERGLHARRDADGQAAFRSRDGDGHALPRRAPGAALAVAGGSALRAPPGHPAALAGQGAGCAICHSRGPRRRPPRLPRPGPGSAGGRRPPRVRDRWSVPHHDASPTLQARDPADPRTRRGSASCCAKSTWAANRATFTSPMRASTGASASSRGGSCTARATSPASTSETSSCATAT